jgi:hypothetical protein
MRRGRSYSFLWHGQAGAHRRSPRLAHKDASRHAITPGWSLGVIGNASGKNSDNEVELDPRRFR